MKPIFLDFLCPDAWKTYSTIPMRMNTVEKARLVSDLRSSLNYAVLLSDSYCILPPAFLLQSDIVYTTIKESKKYLEYDEIRMPLKETSIDAYIAKKANEYRYVKKDFQGFYQRDEAEKFLNEYRYSIMQRSVAMGSSIATKWTQFSDSSHIWKPVVSCAPHKADRIRMAPTLLKSRGLSVTLEAILKVEKLYPSDGLKFAINQAIQHEYIGGYLDEYNAVIISNIPPKPILLNFNISIESKYYDYAFLQRVLRKAGGEPLIQLIAKMSPEDVYALKTSQTFMTTREYYRKICEENPEKVWGYIEEVNESFRDSYINTYTQLEEFFKRAADLVDTRIENDTRKIGGRNRVTIHKKTLFISYQSIDSPIAELIVSHLRKAVGDQISISQYTQLEYRASFREFMNTIEDHDYVICIVSDSYLKSLPCMYEVGEVVKSHHYQERILHIVLNSDDAKFYNNPEGFKPADVFSYEGRLSYVAYWKDRYDKLQEEIIRVGNIEATRSSVNTLTQIGNILRNDIQEFTNYIGEHNVKSFGELYRTGFQEIISAMGLSADKDLL